VKPMILVFVLHFVSGWNPPDGTMMLASVVLLVHPRKGISLQRDHFKLY
jgi:hypothetical protein